MNQETKVNILEKDYLDDLTKIKLTIKSNQAQAMVIVNRTMILTYYQIGKIINQRKKWGNKFIERLSIDLKDYGKGYSVRNLKYMSSLAKEFDDLEFVQQVAAQIPWFTLIEIVQKSSSHEEIVWYIKETYRNQWSRSIVLNQFKLKAYERNQIKPTTSISEESLTPNKITNLFKDTYVFDFLSIASIKNERELQRTLIGNISDFILELGTGFSFVAEKYKLRTEEESYEIDLLFYHIPTHSYVVIELKMHKFKPEYIGQLLFYTNYIDTYVKGENDSETIGIILCPEANGFICRTTLKNTKNMAISKYKLIEELPKYLQKKLKDIPLS